MELRINELRVNNIVLLSSLINGLTGYYYELGNVISYPPVDPFPSSGFQYARVDPNIYFFNTPWATDIHDNDYYSVRWVGYVKGPITGSVTFSMVSDDGCRFFFNNSLDNILTPSNSWRDQGATTTYTYVADMVENQLYPIEIHYYDNLEGNEIRFSWAYTGQSETAVPNSHLFTTSL
jgi:hypothetical protein